MASDLYKAQRINGDALWELGCATLDNDAHAIARTRGTIRTCADDEIGSLPMEFLQGTPGTTDILVGLASPFPNYYGVALVGGDGLVLSAGRNFRRYANIDGTAEIFGTMSGGVSWLRVLPEGTADARAIIAARTMEEGA